MVLLHNAVNFTRGYTSVDDEDTELPGKLELAQNYPNPFNPTTTFSFELPNKGHVNLAIYNVLGQHVATAYDGEFDAGRHTVNFNAGDLTSGVYFYKLTAGESVKTKKMVVLK